jgi:hypothetical protein
MTVESWIQKRGNDLVSLLPSSFIEASLVAKFVMAVLGRN